MTRPRIPIGYSDFLQLRGAGLHYVDKSAFVAEVLRSTAQVILLPRPRRFGKTLNLSTLHAFVERTDQDREPVFSDLAVWKSGPEVRAHFGRHPVVFLTFKDVKTASWEDCRAAITKVVAEECRRHERTLAPVLTESEQPDWQALRSRSADNATLWRSLALLCEWLHRATGERALVLVDEYDTPIHAGFHFGYYDRVVELFRNLFSGAFKDNSHLEKGVLTGILRVAKESIFSGLNNLSVHTLLSKPFSTHFGFTPDEVSTLAEACGEGQQMPEIDRWYDGYCFGGQVMYNPWSVLSYLAHPQDGFKPYWVNTASDDILRELLVQRGMVSAADLETLLSGGSVPRILDEHIVLRDVHQNTDAVWSFLVFSGYLKAGSQAGFDTLGRPIWRLEVPNLEVRQVYAGLFAGFLAKGVGGSERVDALCKALLGGDAKGFGRILGELMLASLSYHDTAVRRPEAVYQAFIVGLLVHLEATHVVTSNREAGYGRYDVLVSPRRPGDPGAVLELKVIDHEEAETAETALQAALAQLADRDYAAALRQRGAAPVHELAAVFDGKRAWARAR